MTTLTSLPISLHISINRHFLISCVIWWKALVFWVELPVHVHKFVLSHELEYWATDMIKHTFVNQQWCECSSYSFSLLPTFLFLWSPPQDFLLFKHTQKINFYAYHSSMECKLLVKNYLDKKRTCYSFLCSNIIFKTSIFTWVFFCSYFYLVI